MIDGQLLDLSDADVVNLGGLDAFSVSGKVVHWNVNVPGYWVGPYALGRVGSYVSSFCEDRSGVYRLIGLDDNGKPAALDRLCARDTTGTLYIGAEGKTFADRSRLTKLVRSLQPPRSGRVYNDEHKAGRRLRSHPQLSERFPVQKLALTWSYCSTPEFAESALFETYFSSFGDLPPLNFRT
jgi:hypothetical protein